MVGRYECSTLMLYVLWEDRIVVVNTVRRAADRRWCSCGAAVRASPACGRCLSLAGVVRRVRHGDHCKLRHAAAS